MKKILYIMIATILSAMSLVSCDKGLVDEVEQLAQHVTDFNVTHHRMEIYGLCKDCQDKRNSQ